MITNEMKAKIFAAYLGSKARRFYRNTGEDTGSHIESDLENINALCFGTGSYTYKLILTPLSEITEQDAKVVASMVIGFSLTPLACVTRNNTTVWSGHNVVHIMDNGQIIWTNTFADIEQDTVRLLGAYDFLRSKGYALSYMGIDLFESDIAIPKQ